MKRHWKLNIEKIKSIEDIKLIMANMGLRIFFDREDEDDIYYHLKDYFDILDEYDTPEEAENSF